MAGLDRRRLLLASAGLGLTACASRAAPHAASIPLLVDLDRQPDEEIELWPGGAPGGEGVDLQEHYVERENALGLPDRAALDVTRPTLTLFRAQDPDGSVMLLIPGGGYRHVVVEKEGFEGARHFNRFGADVYVLKYRLPHQGWAAGPDTPLQDAQRALRLIRSRAPHAQVTAMGFSAGGHLCGSLCQRFDEPVYTPRDEADALSARPDLGVLVYPVTLMRPPHGHAGSRTHLLGQTPSADAIAKYDLTTAPNPDGPPLFLLHTLEDASVPVENSLELAVAARRAGLPAVLHVFDRGEHGFGLRVAEGSPLAKWPGLVLDWTRAQADTAR